MIYTTSASVRKMDGVSISRWGAVVKLKYSIHHRKLGTTDGWIMMGILSRIIVSLQLIGFLVRKSKQNRKKTKNKNKK